jgi:hypothetical protein
MKAEENCIMTCSIIHNFTLNLRKIRWVGHVPSTGNVKTSSEFYILKNLMWTDSLGELGVDSGIY